MYACKSIAYNTTVTVKYLLAKKLVEIGHTKIQIRITKQINTKVKDLQKQKKKG